VRFPLKDVTVKRVRRVKQVTSPLYADSFWQMNQDEFAMQVEGVGTFYARDGNEVEYSPVPGASRESLELYLNGSVYGAILHQRKILPLHGSSFLYEGKGIMLCGEAGAGKSSLTASFCLDGAEFLTDDVTPIIFNGSSPYIWAMSDRIKLWSDTVKQLKMDSEVMKRINPGTDKYYYTINGAEGETFRLSLIFILRSADMVSVACKEVNGSNKFEALRNEIYRFEYLNGMPENNAVYFRNIIDVSSSVKVYEIKRPGRIQVLDLKMFLEENLTRDNSLQDVL